MNVQYAYKNLQKDLEEKENRFRAQKEKSYLKSPWKLYGVSVPTCRLLVDKVLKKYPEMTKEDLLNLVDKLWQSVWHEEKSMAIMFLAKNVRLLDMNDFALVERMIDTVTGWDHLDELAVHVLGEMVTTHQSVWQKTKIFIKSDSYWKRRAAILCQLKLFRVGKGDLKTYKEMCLDQFQEKPEWSSEERFFIRKVIGWTLREISKKNPVWVVNFVKENKEKMSTLSIREGTRKLPDKYKRMLS